VPRGGSLVFTQLLRQLFPFEISKEVIE
jgi:hypothetical protein